MANSSAIEPLVLSIEQTMDVASESRWQVHKHMRDGTYVAVKDGTRTKITLESVKRRIASLPRATFTAPPLPGRRGRPRKSPAPAASPQSDPSS
jgi:hypothetical protein